MVDITSQIDTSGIANPESRTAASVKTPLKNLARVTNNALNGRQGFDGILFNASSAGIGGQLISATRSRIDLTASAPSDLVTISSEVEWILLTNASAHLITLKSSGNIRVFGSGSLPLYPNQVVQLFRLGTLYYVVGAPSGLEIEEEGGSPEDLDTLIIPRGSLGRGGGLEYLPHPAARDWWGYVPGRASFSDAMAGIGIDSTIVNEDPLGTSVLDADGAWLELTGTTIEIYPSFFPGTMLALYPEFSIKIKIGPTNLESGDTLVIGLADARIGSSPTRFVYFRVNGLIWEVAGDLAAADLNFVAVEANHVYRLRYHWDGTNRHSSVEDLTNGAYGESAPSTNSLSDASAHTTPLGLVLHRTGANSRSLLVGPMIVTQN